MAGNARHVAVVEDEVPLDLRDLIPVAEMWGFWNPHVCDEVIESTSTQDLRVFVRAIEAKRQAIDNWLNPLPKDMKKWPKAAEIFLCMIRNWHEAACDLYARDNYGPDKTSAQELPNPTLQQTGTAPKTNAPPGNHCARSGQTGETSSEGE